jgi:lipoprotein-anchoring transpeptidase ErfK/SrfK
MGKKNSELPFEELMQQNRRLRLIIKLLILFFLALILVLLVFKKNAVPTKFKLVGNDVVVLNVGEDKYKEEGYKAYLFKKDVSKNVKISDNIDYSKIGSYEIKYNLVIKNLNIDKTIIRKVNIVDKIPPELTINSDMEVYADLNGNYAEPTYSAIDNCDGDITDKVKVENNLDLSQEGEYIEKFTVEDSSGNITTKEIKIIVQEKFKNTYIVISIGDQWLTYYSRGRIALETPVVTGNNGNTPYGTYYLNNKARNVTLKGPPDDPYESFVYYWMPFISSTHGMHDATWRWRFGGNIYTYDPSHGCVNMPLDKAEDLYYMVEIGTPVYIVD